MNKKGGIVIEVILIIIIIFLMYKIGYIQSAIDWLKGLIK
jgi:hypothetical protein